MNKKRRTKNRDTAKNLAEVLAFKKRQAHICPECGMQGEYHWVQAVVFESWARGKCVQVSEIKY